MIYYRPTGLLLLLEEEDDEVYPTYELMHLRNDKTYCTAPNGNAIFCAACLEETSENTLFRTAILYTKL